MLSKGRSFMLEGKTPVSRYFSKSFNTSSYCNLYFLTPYTSTYCLKLNGNTSIASPFPVLPGNSSISPFIFRLLEPVTVITSFSTSPESISTLMAFHHSFRDVTSSKKIYDVSILSDFLNSKVFLYHFPKRNEIRKYFTVNINYCLRRLSFQQFNN